MNNPPFRIGQRVVALVDCPSFLVKGETYTVLSIDLCTRCKKWDVGFEYYRLPGPVKHTCSCGNQLPIRRIYTADSKKFAPIEENRIKYVAVSETLRGKAVEIAAIETN